MKPHGLKGEVTISLQPEAPQNWETTESLFVEEAGALIPYFIESISTRGAKAFLKLEEVSSAEEAGTLKNASLYLPKSARPKLPHGEFYDDEVIGFQVVDDTSGKLGAVTTIERAGINRFLIVEYLDKEIMIPVQRPILTSINRTKKVIRVNLPDGFLEI